MNRWAVQDVVCSPPLMAVGPAEAGMSMRTLQNFSAAVSESQQR